MIIKSFGYFFSFIHDLVVFFFVFKTDWLTCEWCEHWNSCKKMLEKDSSCCCCCCGTNIIIHHEVWWFLLLSSSSWMDDEQVFFPCSVIQTTVRWWKDRTFSMRGCQHFQKERKREKGPSKIHLMCVCVCVPGEHDSNVKNCSSFIHKECLCIMTHTCMYYMRELSDWLSRFLMMMTWIKYHHHHHI